MKTKLFEIRDSATFIPILAVKLGSDNREERYLLARAGYGADEAQSNYVLLAQISGGVGKATTDPFKWNDRRTYLVAHQYIVEHFDELESGGVVDVQYILGEKPNPKLSERLTESTTRLMGE